MPSVIIKPRSDRLTRGTVYLPPCGLREAVLRADLSRGARKIDGRGSRSMRLIRAWQRGDGCTQEQWNLLCRLVKDGPTPEDRAAALRVRDGVSILSEVA